MAKSKSTVGGLGKEKAELLEERASQLERLEELDGRLQSGDASLSELRVAADEMAQGRDFVEAIDRRLVAVGEQTRELERAELEARVAVLREVEDAAFLEFCQAVDALQGGPMRELLDAQRAIKDAGGFYQYGHAIRTVVKGVIKFQNLQSMRASMARQDRKAGLIQ